MTDRQTTRLCQPSFVWENVIIFCQKSYSSSSTTKTCSNSNGMNTADNHGASNFWWCLFCKHTHEDFHLSPNNAEGDRFERIQLAVLSTFMLLEQWNLNWQTVEKREKERETQSLLSPTYFGGGLIRRPACFISKHRLHRSTISSWVAHRSEDAKSRRKISRILDWIWMRTSFFLMVDPGTFSRWSIRMHLSVIVCRQIFRG